MKILVGYPGTIEKSGGMQNICAQFSNAMSERGHQVQLHGMEERMQNLFIRYLKM